jgi:acetyl-CoA C-acetyltransferase
MQAVVSAVHGLIAGDGHLYLAGGMENMSRAPFLAPQMRSGQKTGDAMLLDSLTHDGLTDPTHGYHMGVTAENIAEKWVITREQQDAFALESHRRATAAQAHGLFREEIVPVSVPSRKGMVTVEADESVRPDTSMEALSKLKAVFKREGGSVTAGNSSGLNDGAAMLAIASDEYALAHGLKPLAEIVSYATVGVDPAFMGIGPSAAVPLAIKRAGLSIRDIDLFELNEAFAAQSLAVCKDLGIQPDRVNVSGGAIAIGHPIGASGARVIVTLVHALRTRGNGYGVASLCIGGGMGIAIVVRAL